MKLSEERIEEIHLAITLWQESGLNQGEFCRQENIHRATFQSWRKKYDPSYGEGHKQVSHSAQNGNKRVPPHVRGRFVKIV